MNKPRLRMFAGPNGSGKSTLKDILKPEWLGVYINPDDMEKNIRQTGFLNFSDYGLMIEEQDIKSFIADSPLVKKYNLFSDAHDCRFANNQLAFNKQEVNSYHASVLSDLIRHALIRQKISFSFETVMSSPDKVQFLNTAQAAGFKTYLYYVATEDVEINIDRVQIRVSQGGHRVAEDKIRSRYVRSLNLLIEAIDYANRAFIFDNSEEDQKMKFIAEVSDENPSRIKMKTKKMPEWFKVALWDKLED